MTPARWYALRWFADHEADINAVMGRRPPSGKMRRLMLREGQAIPIMVGSFGYRRWELTSAGRELLANKRKRKSRELKHASKD
jgi:hypothetical protein